MTTRVTGLAELRTAFAAFGQSLDSAKGPLRRVTRQFANKVAKLAKEKVPVDEGKLRASIRAIGLRKAQAKKEGLTVALIVAPSNPKRKRGDQAPDEPGETLPSNYGAMVEGGTEKQQPQPYLRPAADEAAATAPADFVELLARDLEKQARRAARNSAGGS